MRNIILIIALMFSTYSCREKAEIRVQNKISKVAVESIYLGDNFIAARLLPGETSRKVEFDNYDLPIKNKVIKFKMFANGKTIFLKTEKTFSLQDGDDILVVLDNDTKVKSGMEENN